MNFTSPVSIVKKANEDMNEIHVKIAEVKIGTTGDYLKACLGSCMGIVFVWKEKNLYGMAHCFLPEGEDEQHEISARYVNQGIVSLMTLMKIKKENVEQIEVYIAGGGNMMNQLIKSNRGQIGKHNTSATEKWLTHFGFKVKKSDVGLDRGIKIYVDCTSGEVEFIRLEDLQDLILKAG